ncbi:MAG: DUF4411 family protein [Magnetococcales bacterium]|nr:DUF4411 family protein [Magnetococcales bacterium]
MYFLDSNVFIEASNRYYSFDICPGFWDWLDREIPNGKVASIVNVYEELKECKDELANWVKIRRNQGMFLDVDDTATQEAFQKIAATVGQSAYKPSAKSQFLAGADPWLIAKALAQKGTVVTHEQPAPDSIKRVPIPNICQEYGIDFINTFDLLRKSSVTFELPTINKPPPRPRRR